VSDGKAAVPVAVTVTSFGFKFGLPPGAGWVFDARVVRNPFWVAELRSYTGLDAPVRDYVLEDPVAGELIDRMHSLLLWTAQRYAERDRAPEPGSRVHRWQASIRGHRRGARGTPAC
jgi:UPF0042 nucleotide-binding protein